MLLGIGCIILYQFEHRLSCLCLRICCFFVSIYPFILPSVILVCFEEFCLRGFSRKGVEVIDLNSVLVVKLLLDSY